MNKLSKAGVSRIGSPTKFLQEVRVELAKVDWPSRDKTARLTAVVIVVSVAVGVYIGALDTLFTYLLKFLVK